MNTILTDDELPPMPDGTHPQSLLGQMLLKYADAREAAVLAKLAQQEPVAWRYKKEGGGWFVSDNEPQYVEQWNDIEEVLHLFTHPAPQQADRQRVPEGWKLVPSRCPLCDYQHGHQIGCENNSLDIYLRQKAAAPEAPAQGIDKETQTMKLPALVDDLIERDPDRAEWIIESAIARNALRKRLMEKKARAALAQKGGAA